jgi:hypothetical protein
LTMLLYIHNLIPKIPARILRKHCQITFLRTFGSRRPPTAPIFLLLVLRKISKKSYKKEKQNHL